VRGRDSRRLRRAARPDRMQACRHGRDRRLGRDGDRVSRHSAIAWCRRRTNLGAGAGNGIRLEPERVMMAGSSASVATRSAAHRNSVLDLSMMPLRGVNQLLHETKEGDFLIKNPRGLHAIACGLDGNLDVVVDGHAGYYCAGMNKRATV